MPAATQRVVSSNVVAPVEPPVAAVTPIVEPMKEARSLPSEVAPVATSAPFPLPAGAPVADAASACIGRTLRIKGEVEGAEDVTVDGNVEGEVTLKDHTLTVGRSGRVYAEVEARTVVVHGKVVGNVVAADKVVVAATGSLQGDVRCARVVLMENARFKGSIDTLREGGRWVGTTAAAGTATGAKTEAAREGGALAALELAGERPAS